MYKQFMKKGIESVDLFLSWYKYNMRITYIRMVKIYVLYGCVYVIANINVLNILSVCCWQKFRAATANKY